MRMNFFKNVYEELVKLYLSNLSLPMVFKPKSISVLLLILIFILLSILFNMGMYYHYTNSDILYILMFASIINLLFLKFNFVIRTFNVFKSIFYFYNLNKIVKVEGKLSIKVPIFYYVYNIICFILSYYLIIKIQYNLFEFNFEIGEYVYIYSYLISPVLSIIYIGYISKEKFIYKKVILDKLGKFIHLLIIFTFVWSLLILVTNLLVFKPILCDSTDSDNQQINKNVQNSTNPTNEQVNANSQNSSTKLNGSRTSSYSPNANITQRNKQMNINSQTINKTINSFNFNPLSDYFNISLLTGNDQANKLATNGSVINSNYFLSELKKLDCSESEDQSDFVNKLLLELHKNFDIRNYSYTEALDLIQILFNQELLDSQQHEFNVRNLLLHASYQDEENSFLYNNKDILIQNIIDCKQLLVDKIIYMNGYYSVIVCCNDCNDELVSISYKGYNLFEIYNKNNLMLIKLKGENYNIRIKRILSLVYPEDESLKSSINQFDQIYFACERLKALLELNMNKINEIHMHHLTFPRSNTFILENYLSDYDQFNDNEFYYLSDYKAFIFKYVDIETKRFYIFPVDSKVKLYHMILNRFKEYNSELFFNKDLLIQTKMLEAINSEIHDLDDSLNWNKTRIEMLIVNNRYNIFEFNIQNNYQLENNSNETILLSEESSKEVLSISNSK